MNKDSKIFVAGHCGLVGSAILKNLQKKGYTNFVLRTHIELDLTNQYAVRSFFEKEKPEYVFLSAAKVGGIVANSTYRADFIYQNLMIQSNVIHAAFQNNVKKLLFLGSTCIYPKETLQPISENSLLTSPLEYTNEPYAVAKIAGIKMCESYNLQYGTNFIAVMPTNLYGPNDNFNLETSHVLPAMIRKMHLAKCLNNRDWSMLREDLNKRPVEGVSGSSTHEEIISVLEKYGIGPKEITLWGTGEPLREFLWSEDMADASVFVMEKINFTDLCSDLKEIRNTHINIGTGIELTIKNLALIIKDKVSFDGELKFDMSRPDGTMRKLTNVSKLHQLGWNHTIEINEGIERLYNWYIRNK